MKKKLFLIALTFFVCISVLNADGISSRTDFLDDVSTEVDYILHNYYGEISEEDLRRGLLNGMHDAVDPWAESFSMAEYKEFMDSLSGDHVGIGVYLEKKEDYILITDVIEDSSADKAGLKAGDRIYMVDGLSISDMELNKSLELLRGKENTEITLTVKKKGSKTPEEIKLIRKPFLIKSVKHYVKDGIDVIKILQFGEYTHFEFLDVLNHNDFKNGLILDLRDNPGGYLEISRQIADDLLPKKDIIAVVQDKYKKEYLISQKEGIKNKMVVLVNENTASASELLAVSLQDNKRALIVGEKTFGKGLIQGLGSYGNRFIKLTIGEYKSPKDRSINLLGVIPDLRVSVEQELFNLHSKLKPLISYTEFKPGDQNDEILGIKERLNYVGEVLADNNKYDEGLVRAVDNFKKEKNLKSGTKIDLEFKYALEKEVKNKALEVIQDKQLLTAVEELKKAN